MPLNLPTEEQIFDHALSRLAEMIIDRVINSTGPGEAEEEVTTILRVVFSDAGSGDIENVIDQVKVSR